MGESALANSPHSDIDCNCRPLRDTPRELRRDFRHADRNGKSPHHQTARIRDWACNLCGCASHGVERTKLDVSRSYLRGVGRSGSDFVDMATLRAVLRYAVQVFYE